MAKHSLLDEMVVDHSTREAKAAGRRASESQMARSLEKARLAKARARRRDDLSSAEADTLAKKVSGPASLGGLTVGDRFEMKKCPVEINGVWRVARIDGANGEIGRILFARRTDGRPGYLPLSENKIRDAVHHGVLQRLG